LADEYIHGRHDTAQLITENTLVSVLGYGYHVCVGKLAWPCALCIHAWRRTICYSWACLNAIEYLKKFGYSGEQGYMLLSTAPCEGKISGIVDIPNACCTLHLPTEIFAFDIRPSATGPVSMPRGAVASTT
jgi:hypothetical protein